jgi:hypothetical protein
VGGVRQNVSNHMHLLKEEYEGKEKNASEQLLIKSDRNLFLIFKI